MTEPALNNSIRIEKSAVGSAIVSGDGNTIYVIYQTAEQQSFQASSETPTKIGPNPYKGLAAFKESDADRYFGREEQVERLWQRFQNLYEQSAAPRFLSVLGPSGCGKSSLVRAGLLPELARRPLPDKEKMRVVVILPGESPLKSLAGGLARLTEDDQTPEVIKKRSYEEELRKGAESGRFDFLQDVSETLPDIQSAPLVVLVEQFEEIYSLCKAPNERTAFIENLMHAASNATGYVAVVITLRSDFLGETQRHKQLNHLISSDQSMIVPAMTTDELRRAIAEPGRQAGYSFDEAMIDLLVNDAEGREGALPLLQFALTRIWEGLRGGKSVVKTYQEIGGVGGSLAKRADEIYDNLTSDEKYIAQRIFTGLVQLGEGTRDTRRRVALRNLMSYEDNFDTFNHVTECFSSPRARLLTLSGSEYSELLEITHEALLDHWGQLQIWLDESREVLREHRKIELEAYNWQSSEKSKEYLLRGKKLSKVKLFRKQYSKISPLTTVEEDLYRASLNQQKKYLAQIAVMLCMVGLIGRYYFVEISSRRYHAWLYSENLHEPILELTKGCKSRRVHRTISGYLPDAILNMLFGICKPLTKSQLSESSLKDLEMSYIDFTSSNFIQSDLENSNLKGSNLENSKLILSKLNKINLEQANLSGSILSSSSLVGSNLQGASLNNVDLSNADLSNADLREAITTGADFTGATLTDTDLRKTGVNDDQIKLAILCRTKLPETVSVAPDRDCFFRNP